MRRMMLGALVACSISLGTVGPLKAGDTALKKEIEELNRLTGVDPTQGMLARLLEAPDTTKKLIETALPLAQKKDGLSYNAALVLAMAAAKQKDLKASDAFFHACGAQAVMEKSTRKLAQSYGALIALYYENRKYSDCVRVCRELLDLKTDDGKQRIVYKAFTEKASGETDFNEYNAFDSAGPMRPVVQEFLVKSLTKQGKYDQAIKVADELIKADDYWDNRRLKVTVLREAGQLGEALTACQDALNRVDRDNSLEPDERDLAVELLRSELSNIFVDQGKIELAADQLETLLKKKPNEPSYYNSLGYVLADANIRLDEAETLIRKALDLDQQRRRKSPNFDPKKDHDNGAYLDSLGWVLFRKKQYADARKYLEMAIQDESTQDLEIYDHLGDVYMALGDREAAIRAWGKGLEQISETRRDRERRADVEKKLESAKSKSAQK